MAFLTKKETGLINIINADCKISSEQKSAAVSEIKYNARLRQDQYRPPVKIFMAVISNHLNHKVANKSIGK